ncbi:MAG: hypothetical protein ACPGTO_03090 [Polaribacter sp.]
MKKLKNIGIYYVVLALLSFILSIGVGLLLFLPLIPIGVLGVVFLVIYLFSKTINNEKPVIVYAPKKWLGLSRVLNVILILLPFILYAISMWYVWRPYKQVVVIPENYEGVIVICYNKKDGQAKEWTGGFLGINASRLIEVDTTGIAKTQFNFHNNAIPFIGAKQTYSNRGGLKIYYKNDLENEINFGRYYGEGMDKYLVNKSELNNLPNIYFTGYNYYPLIIFVVTKPKNYHHYFMSKEEMIDDYVKEHNQEPSDSRLSNTRILNKKYNHYYKSLKYYLKN